MAEAPITKISSKKALKKLKLELAKHAPGADEQDQTMAWYLSQSNTQMCTHYNTYAELMAQRHNLHVCVLGATKDANGTYPIKNYSVYYNRLKKFNEAWVGFYPSVYPWEVVLDMDGNTDNITIKDTEQLDNIPNLNTAEKFWFAGIQYKTTKVDLKHPSNASWGFDFIAEDKKTTQEGIYIRKTADVYFIVNYALNSNKVRQDFGSAAALCGVLRSYFKTTFLNEDEDDTF